MYKLYIICDMYLKLQMICVCINDNNISITAVYHRGVPLR